MRFAYLILAHSNYEQLLKLLKCLDHNENEIYLHIDKKWLGIDYDRIYCSIRKAKIHVYSVFYVYWGDISQTRCQMFLLKKAIEGQHDYYHLLSGNDMPIKRHRDIVRFFEDNYGKEFVFFENMYPEKKDNCSLYHMFYTYDKKYSSRIICRFVKFFDDLLLAIQQIMGIERRFFVGDNWYSISERLARDFLSHEKEIMSKIKYTRNSDELVLQNFLGNKLDEYELYSYETENNVTATMRAIDWKRGQPYVWRKGDFFELMQSKCLYARKFDESIDVEIIDRIVEYVLKE
ncbi:MAG: beta-1,6-N-acetylglucosaminyltransferase [Anaerovibrio sp.]